MKVLPKLLYLILLFLCVGCGKIELDEPKGDDSTEQGDDKDADDPEVSEDAISVAQLLCTSEFSSVVVEGYIVGSIAGTSLTKAVFGVEGARNSNILIADSPNETDYKNCAPVELPNGSEYRAVLNLVDNPGMLGAHIRLCGEARTYFSVIGLKGLFDYAILDDSDTPSVDRPFPTLSTEEAEVFEGC